MKAEAKVKQVGEVRENRTPEGAYCGEDVGASSMPLVYV